MKNLWNNIEKLHEEYNSLDLNSVIDYEKYKLYSIVTSSTQLEGSTLTELDTKLLLDDGITAKGKPLEHHLMVKDNFEAMRCAMQAGDEKQCLSPALLQKLNSLNMAGTGAVVRKKIPEAVEKFCNEFNRQMLSCLLTLKKAKDTGDLNPFREFMAGQHLKTIRKEIATNKKLINTKGFSLVL